MTHFEQLLSEFYDWQGYLVKHNILVGPRPNGGYEMELDIVAYHPITHHLLHVESSLDADSWEERERRFSKKFISGKKYILQNIFTWLKEVDIEQVAVLVSHPEGREMVGGGKIISVDEMIKIVREKVKLNGIAGKSAIPEQYPLLRTIQLVVSGYYKKI